MQNVEIYTDGACSGNPGDGGWAAVLFCRGYRKEISGYEPDTTNNRMELMAVIKGLCALNEPCNVKLYTDSAYVSNAFLQNWLEAWHANCWRTSSNKQVKNHDLWEKLCELVRVHSVEFIKVKGHADNEHNNRCDLLARQAIIRKN